MWLYVLVLCPSIIVLFYFSSCQINFVSVCVLCFVLLSPFVCSKKKDFMVTW